RMLPAIYFVFSRRGCEEAMRRVYGQSLLSGAEARQLEQAVDEALADNPRLAEHAHLPYLRQGIAAHHAGLLPAWKALVERLFQQGLIKVVFATETLAAGINMPARTTVIGALVKYSDEGHRMLTASEFLQMSGRAGRRGMDEVGHVVMVHHPREAPEDAARLARSRPDPLLSRFTPRYEMVLNLLQRYPPEQARQLVEKSFGQFLAGGTSEQTAREEAQVRQRIEEIKAPLCPGEPGDLPSYRKLRRHEARITEQLRSLKGLARGRRAPGLGPAIRALEGRRIEIRQRYGSMPCHGCPVQQPCSRQQQELQRLHHRHSELVRQERRALPPYWQQFQQLASVLRERGYLEGDRPTWRGQLAAALRGTNVLFLAEVASSGILEELTPEQAAAVLNALVTEETRKVQGRLPAPSDEVFTALEQIEVLALEIGRLQRRHGVEVPLLLNPAFAGITERWAQGHAWDDLVDGSGLEEGDVVRALRRTLDMARQWYHAPGTPPLLASMCRRIEALIARDEVLDSLLVE
ncbi:MAG TPA: helicase-related protein, partial [Candidatus Nitrosotenuis sp.]|nr:helicase-related protein [Candidatus Nitrosotenuis sp.]